MGENVCGTFNARSTVPGASQLYKFQWPIAPYPFAEDVFAHFTADSAGNFTTFMANKTGAESMEWKDVSGQNHHATVYGTPSLVWDKTFPDGVARKSVHFKAKAAKDKAVDGIDFPDQSELGIDYSVFAVAGYRKRENKGRVFTYVGDVKRKIQRRQFLKPTVKVDEETTKTVAAELPYSFTVHFDLTARSHVDKKTDFDGVPTGRPAVVFIFGQKDRIAHASYHRGRAPAVFLKPKNDTLIVMDGDREKKHAGCSIVNFPMNKETHVEIRIELKKFLVKVDGTVVCSAQRQDRSQAKDLLTQNPKGIFLKDAQLLLGGGHNSYSSVTNHPTADASIRNFKVISNADVGTWQRVLQANDKDWCVN